MRRLHGIGAAVSVLLATGMLAALGPLAAAQGVPSSSATEPATPGTGNPKAPSGPGAAAKLPWPEVSVGFHGHFACRTFAGQNRELAAAVSDLQVTRAAALLKEGADVNARSVGSHTRSMTLLQTAVWHRWGADCVHLLLDLGADLEARDDVGNTALIYACQSGPEPPRDVVELLVQGGAQVNVRGAKGMTALMHAAMQDQPLPVIEILLRSSADVNGQDDSGWTALMHCTRNRTDCVDVARVLIAAGADVNTVHRHGGTALLNAAYLGRSRIVAALLAAGADANTADDGGWTPLIGAAMNGHTAVVRALLQAGARVTATDRLGRSALTLAKANRHTAVVELLVNAHAVR
jgi:uncharacterized protein